MTFSNFNTVSQEFINENPVGVSVVVAAANGTVALLALLEEIKAGVAIAGGVMTIVIGIFTIRLLIIKTKNEKLKN